MFYRRLRLWYIPKGATQVWGTPISNLGKQA